MLVKPSNPSFKPTVQLTRLSQSLLMSYTSHDEEKSQAQPTMQAQPVPQAQQTSLSKLDIENTDSVSTSADRTKITSKSLPDSQHSISKENSAEPPLLLSNDMLSDALLEDVKTLNPFARGESSLFLMCFHEDIYS